MNISIYRSRRLHPALLSFPTRRSSDLLLLGLIAVVFLGIGSYRKGSDKAKCKMQLAAAQKAVRSQTNIQNKYSHATFSTTDAFGAGKTLENEPTCPSGGTYTWVGTIPA